MKCTILVAAAVLGRSLAGTILEPSLSDEWHIEVRANIVCIRVLVAER